MTLGVTVVYDNSDSGKTSSNNNSGILCHIKRGCGDYFYPDKLKNAEILNIEATEAYYVINGISKEILVIEKLETPIADANNSDSVYDRIIYTVSSSSTDITKDILLDMAKSLQ